MTERLYEGLFLVDAAVAATDWADIEKQISGLIEQQGATIEYSERWPEQRLAYPVKGIKRGVYFLAYFTSNTDAIAAIRSDGQLNENVLRMLIVQEEFLGVEMAKRKEAAARAAAVPVAEPETQPESKPESKSESDSESKSESDSESDSGSEGEGVVEDAMAASEGDSLDASPPEADADSDGEVAVETEAVETEAVETEAVETEAVDAAAVDAAESEPEVSESEVPEEVATAEGDEETPVGDSVEEVANTEEEIN
ncbi:MAG: 30S ribosomal protein S6 [Planctomycetota bacterium]|nr:30S ribosomal protein S6 [Planctomycetota bacterium]